MPSGTYKQVPERSDFNHDDFEVPAADQSIERAAITQSMNSEKGSGALLLAELPALGKLWITMPIEDHTIVVQQATQVSLGQ